MGNSTYWEKKVFLTAFRQVLTKILPAAWIQLQNYDLFEKAQLELSSLIQNRVQQDYLPESYAPHLHSYQKCHKIVAPTRCGLFPLPVNIYGKPWGCGKILPNSQKFTHFPHQKIPLNRFKSFNVKSFICSPSNSNFQVIILCNLHF